MMVRILDRARTPLGKSIATAVGLGTAFAIIYHSGIESVLHVLSTSIVYFPWIVLLEFAIASCSVCAMRAFYGEEAQKIPLSALLKAGFIGYAVMGLVPAGRTIAEGVRATYLSRFTSASRAAVAATQMQAVALFANCFISIPCFFVLYHLSGISLPTVLIFLNFLVTAILGIGILVATRRARLGSRMGRIIPSIESFGREFDEHFRKWDPAFSTALCFEFLGRILQVLQNGILVVAVGGPLGLFPALGSEAIHLAGAATGDLIPAQLGFTELSYRLSSQALGLSTDSAVSIAVIAHLAQILWVALSCLLPLFIRQNRNESQEYQMNSY